MLGLDPTFKIAVGSYTIEVARRNSLYTRAILNSDTYKWIFPNTIIAIERTDHWETTRGGCYLAIGVGGGLTGFTVDVMIIDDPHKDRAQALSETRREAVWDWYTSVARTRLTNRSVIILIMTRWHEDDLAGRLQSPNYVAALKQLGVYLGVFRTFIFPAEAKENDMLGRKVGEWLFPERYSEQDYLQHKYSVRSDGQVELSPVWSALYQQAPVPDSGELVARSDFSGIVSWDQVPKGLNWGLGIDFAAGSKTVNDYTALAKTAYDLKTDTIYIALVARWRLAWPRARPKVLAMARAEKLPIWADATGGLLAVADDLATALAGDVIVQRVRLSVNKEVNAMPWLARAKLRKVVLVAGPWNEGFISEVVAFPNGTNDDQVDAVSISLNAKLGRIGRQGTLSYR